MNLDVCMCVIFLVSMEKSRNTVKKSVQVRKVRWMEGSLVIFEGRWVNFKTKVSLKENEWKFLTMSPLPSSCFSPTSPLPYSPPHLPSLGPSPNIPPASGL